MSWVMRLYFWINSHNGCVTGYPRKEKRWGTLTEGICTMKKNRFDLKNSLSYTVMKSYVKLTIDSETVTDVWWGFCLNVLYPIPFFIKNMTSIHVKLIQQQHKFSITTVKEYKELLNSVIISRYKTEKKKKNILISQAKLIPNTYNIS